MKASISLNASVRAHYLYFSCLNRDTVMSVRCVRQSVCAHGVCVLVFTVPISLIPLMKAHQLCRYSDSAGAPLGLASVLFSNVESN